MVCSTQKRRLREDLMAAKAPHEEGSGGVCLALRRVLSSGDSDRTRDSSVELCQGRVRMGARKRFFPRVWWAWNRLSRTVGTALSTGTLLS